MAGVRVRSTGMNPAHNVLAQLPSASSIFHLIHFCFTWGRKKQSKQNWAGEEASAPENSVLSEKQEGLAVLLAYLRALLKFCRFQRRRTVVSSWKSAKENYTAQLMLLKVCEKSNCSTSIKEKLVLMERRQLSLCVQSDEISATAQTVPDMTFRNLSVMDSRRGESSGENPVTMHFRDKYKWDKGWCESRFTNL